MFKVKEDSSIHINRGNVGILEVQVENDDGSSYTFQQGDVIRLGIYKKGDYNTIILEKEIPVEDATLTVEIPLTKEDTTIGSIINKPVDYWYEIELNPDTEPQTIIGHDEKGAKIFKLYPEGVEEE